MVKPGYWQSYSSFASNNCEHFVQLAPTDKNLHTPEEADEQSERANEAFKRHAERRQERDMRDDF